MSAPTLARTSAYPSSVTELLPRAREWVTELGHVPSQNRIKTEFKVGTDKARDLRNTLLDETPTAPTSPAAGPADPAPTTPDDPLPGALLDLIEPTPATPDRVEQFPDPEITVPVESPQTARVTDPVTTGTAPTGEGTSTTPAESTSEGHRVRSWPVLLLALPAFVAIWSGWVGLGGLTGFGVVHPLPGIWDSFHINSAITLPIGVETYAAYALRVWLSGAVPGRARRFAKWSAVGSLLLGAAGQVAYHLMSAAHVTHSPWPITTAVASLPVAVVGGGAALAHLIRDGRQGTR